MRRNTNTTKENPKYKGSNKTKRGNKRGSQFKSSDKEAVEEVAKSGNDPAWYASNPVILRDAASYPFSYSTGATETHDSTLYPSSDFAKVPASQVPGVCSLHIHPVVGTSHYATDPINVAAQSVYSFVRHANSGHSNYDPADLMIYIMAMANMYSFLVWCQRTYGYALTYDQRNRYIPVDLLRCNNVDADDVRSNLANFRFWINTLIAKMVSFAVPATMSIFSRMSFMYSDYYIEGTSIKDQLYQYVPDGFYKFALDSNQLGKLEWKPFNYGTLMTVNDIITYGEDLFNAIWSQEDFGIMSGDILKAYGDNIIKLSPIPEYYSIVPKFDAMVLTQMKNADLTRADISDISQDPNDGTILQAIIPLGYSTSDTFYGTTTAMSSAQATRYDKAMMSIIKDYRVLTVDTDYPGPEVVIEATRLKVVYNTAKAWLVAGTEVVTRCIITTAPGVDIGMRPIVETRVDGTGEKPTVIATDSLLEAASHFHYVPRIWVVKLDAVDDTNLFVYQKFDIDNFTIMTFEDVKKLHEAATINMFAVPSVAKVQ